MDSIHFCITGYWKGKALIVKEYIYLRPSSLLIFNNSVDQSCIFKIKILSNAIKLIIPLFLIFLLLIFLFIGMDRSHKPSAQ